MHRTIGTASAAVGFALACGAPPPSPGHSSAPDFFGALDEWCATATEPVLVRACTGRVAPPGLPSVPTVLPGLSFDPHRAATLDRGLFGAMQLWPDGRLAFKYLDPVGPDDPALDEASAELRRALADGAPAVLSPKISARLGARVINRSARVDRDSRGLFVGSTGSSGPHGPGLDYQVAYAAGDPAVWVVVIGSASAAGQVSVAQIGVLLDQPAHVPTLPD